MPRRNLVAVHLEGLDNASPALTSFLGNLQKWAKRVLSIAAIVGGIRLVSIAIKDLTQNAAEIEGIERAFISLTASVNRSNKEMLSSLRSSSRGMVTNLELMRSFNLGAQLVSRQFATELPQAFEMLTKVSIATGESMTYLMDSLVRGIGRLNPRILDNLGVQIDLNAAYKRFAGELDTTAEALTKAQKQTIAWMGTLEKLKINTAALPDVTGTLAFQYAVLRTNIANARQEVERSFAPVLTNLYRRLNELIEGPLTGFGTVLRNWVAPAIDVVIDRFGDLAIAAEESMATGMGAFLEKAKEWAWNAIVWGNNIMIGFADGMIRGATIAITTAMRFIGNLLTSWLVGASPPKVAPGLNEWGAVAFTEYLKGFFDAQFDVLEGLQDPIKRALQSLVDMGELAEDALGPAFVNISKMLAASIPEMMKVGKISKEIIDSIRGSVGGYADEIIELLQRQLNLAGAVDKVRIAEERLEESRRAHEAVKDRVRDIADEYNRLLAAGAGEDVLGPLRAQFKEARKGLGVTREQIKESESQKDAAEGQLDFLSKQVNLQERLLDQLFSMGEALRPITESMEKAKKGVADIIDEIELPTVPEGLDLSGGLDAQFQLMKDKINALIDELLLPWKEKWEEEWKPMIDNAILEWGIFTDTVKLFWAERVQPIIDEIDKLLPTEGFMSNLAKIAGYFAVGAIAALAFKLALLGVAAVVGAIGWPILLLIGTLALLKTAWDNNWLGMRDTLTEFWEVSAKPQLAEIGTWLEEKIPLAGEGISKFFKVTLPEAFDTVVAAISDVLMPPFETIRDFFVEYLIPLGEAWNAVWDAIGAKISEFATAFLENILLPKLEELHEWWDEKIAPVLREVTDEILPPLQEGWQILMDAIGGAITSVLDPLKEAWDNIKEAIKNVTGWLDTLAGKIGDIKVPAWLQGRSPPPMAKWLAEIAGAAALAGEALGNMGDVPLISRSLRPSTGGAGTGFAYGDTYNFNQTINTRATQANTIRDFNMARALYAD